MEYKKSLVYTVEEYMHLTSNLWKRIQYISFNSASYKNIWVKSIQIHHIDLSKKWEKRSNYYLT